MKDNFAGGLGFTGLTFPAWSDLLAVGWQGFIGVMGACVLAATLWSKVLEIRQRSRDLNK